MERDPPQNGVHAAALPPIQAALTKVADGFRELGHTSFLDDAATLQASVDRLTHELRNSVTMITESITRVDNRLGVIDIRLNGLDNRFTDLNTQMAAMNHNSYARAQNCLRLTRESVLVPLHDNATNLEIPDFPRTPADIARLNTAQAEVMLQALGQGIGADVGINLAEKRERVRMAIGLLPS